MGRTLAFPDLFSGGSCVSSSRVRFGDGCPPSTTGAFCFVPVSVYGRSVSLGAFRCHWDCLPPRRLSVEVLLLFFLISRPDLPASSIAVHQQLWQLSVSCPLSWSSPDL